MPSRFVRTCAGQTAPIEENGTARRGKPFSDSKGVLGETAVNESTLCGAEGIGGVLQQRANNAGTLALLLKRARELHTRITDGTES